MRMQAVSRVFILVLFSSAVLYTNQSIRLISSTGLKNERWGRLRNPKGNSDPISGFTLCHRSRYTVLDGSFTVGFANEFIKTYLRTFYPDIFFSFEKTSFLLPFRWEILSWTSLCLSFSNVTGKIVLVRDGINIDIGNKESPVFISSKLTRANLLANLRIGQFNPGSSGFSGSVGDINVWDRPLYTSYMRRWTKCDNPEEGNVLAWNSSQWNLSGYQEEYYNEVDLCQTRSHHLLPFYPAEYSTAVQTCRHFNALAGVCQNKETQTEMVQKVYNKSLCELAFWCGIDDQEEEGVLKDINIGSEIGTFRPFGTGEPNGLRQENCVESRITGGPKERGAYSYYWNDARCDIKRCFFCQMAKNHVIKLRGLTGCELSFFDTQYKRSDELSGNRYIISGFTGSKILYNETSNTWILLSKTGDSEVYATFQHLSLIYPFGKQNWKMHNTNCLEETTVTFHLTVCDENSFNCNDGTCVSMEKRCNLEMDCPDRSDEMDCTFLDIPRWYLPDIIPPPLKKEKTNKSQIEMNIFIMKILAIDIVNLAFETQFRLTMSWFDSRLSFKNLKEDQFKNWVTQNESKSIWVPTIKFQNTKSLLTTVKDDKAYITIQRFGNHTVNSVELLENYFKFTGEDNKLSVSRNYDVVFICDYNLRWYPFDTQNCTMNLTLVKEEDGHFLDLIKPGEVTHSIPEEVFQYFIQKIYVNYETSEDGMRRIVVRFELGRMILSQIMTIYVPTFLIMIVSYLTTFFNNSKWFGHIITINLTAMLVLTTMLTSISDDLPKTAEVKYIDIWMLFSLFVPVMEILLHTIEDHLKRREKESEDSRPPSRDRSNSDTWLSVNAKIVKVLPLEESLHSEKERPEQIREKKDMTRWTLLYIEFIGNVVILVVMMVFTTFYWVIGLLVKYNFYG